MKVQYIVEWRRCMAGETYLFTDKSAGRPAPHMNRRSDPEGVIRPVVVGMLDPDNGFVFYLEDQK